MQVVIFNFAAFSAIDLENHGREVSFRTNFESKNLERKKSYWAARCALAFLIRQAEIDSKISHDESLGFPILVNNKGEVDLSHYVSIAHTEEVVVVAISNKTIGIDIEKKDRNANNVIERILGETEKKTYAEFPQNIKVDGYFLEKSLLYWVVKESAAKATGLGMTRGLEIFEIKNRTENFYQVTSIVDAPQKLTHPLCLPFIVDNYVLSICSEAELLRRGIFDSFFRLLDLNGKFEQLNRFENSESH